MWNYAVLKTPYLGYKLDEAIKKQLKANISVQE